MKYFWLILGIILIVVGIIWLCNLPEEKTRYIYEGTTCLSTDDTCEAINVFGKYVLVDNIGQNKNLVQVGCNVDKQINHTFMWVNETKVNTDSEKHFCTTWACIIIIIGILLSLINALDIYYERQI